MNILRFIVTIILNRANALIHIAILKVIKISYSLTELKMYFIANSIKTKICFGLRIINNNNN